MLDLESQRQQRIALASSQQQNASDPRLSIWVEASAGTGKTKVLSDRVLRLLLNGAKPGRILCLTYTKAAASEMNNRIIDRLAKWAVMTDLDLEKELQNLLVDSKQQPLARRLFALLLDTPGGIKIQTIHSFCQEILKRFPIEAKISPHFEVMDERETKEILDSIKTDLLSDIPSSVSSDIKYLTSACNEYSFPKILSSITDNCSFLENYFSLFPSAEAIATNISKSLNLSPDINIDTKIKQFWQSLPQNDLDILLQALNIGSDTSKQTAQQLKKSITDQDFYAYLAIFLTKEEMPKKNFLVKKSQEKFPQAITLYQDECQRLQEYQNQLRSINLRDATVAVLNLAHEIILRYQTYKSVHAKMDYSDLINKTKILLHSPQVADWILYKLDGGIDHILIDEAQDTSPDQWSIIEALSADFFAGSSNNQQSPTVFIVGDRKQSIYSFQGADVNEFEKMHQHFSTLSPNFKNIHMEVSFRSTSAILDTVNKIFSNSQATKGVTTDQQNLNHIPSRIGECGHVELWEITQPYSDKNSDNIWLPPIERFTAQSASSLLAQKIAAMIKQKVTSHEIKADGSPLRYSDFLILIQRRNSFAEEMVRACKNIGVEIAGIDKIKLNDQIAVLDIMSAARFAVLPDDDLNLCCLLKSPLFGLDDDDLFKLCYQRETTSVWQRLQQSSDYQTIVTDLQNLYLFAPQLRPFEFFSYILSDLSGRQKFISRLGNECEDALDEFINLTLTFEQKNIPTLQNFIEWMDRDDVEIKRNLEQNDLNAVRLMTVHGSKGLQAPVVILPDTVRLKTLKKESGWLKNGTDLFYPLGKEYYNTKCQTLQNHEQSKLLEEYNRLLYVALTRAGEQLYICGYSNNKPNPQSWYEICKTGLSQIAQLDGHHNLVIHQDSAIPPKSQKPSSPTAMSCDTPQWLKQKAHQESPLSRPLTPSHLDEDTTAVISPLLQEDHTRLYLRGSIIHKLLQFLPLQDFAKREQSAKIYLDKYADSFSDSEKTKILHEVFNLLNSEKFRPLFSSDSMAEVPVMGEIDGRIISGQIDRLILTDDTAIIIDYKTNRPAAQSSSEIPVIYKKQLQTYKKLIAKIYPAKQVKAYILWTNTAQMMEIL